MSQQALAKLVTRLINRVIDIAFKKYPGADALWTVNVLIEARDRINKRFKIDS